MEPEKIFVTAYCEHYKIEIAFINELDEMGIINFLHDDNREMYLDAACLSDLERCRKLHYELHINHEGIDVIMKLLKKQKQLQDEIQSLENRLKIYL